MLNSTSYDNILKHVNCNAVWNKRMSFRGKGGGIMVPLPELSLSILTSLSRTAVKPAFHFTHGLCEVVGLGDKGAILRWMISVLHQRQSYVSLLLRHDLLHDTTDILKMGKLDESD